MFLFSHCTQHIASGTLHDDDLAPEQLIYLLGVLAQFRYRSR